MGDPFAGEDREEPTAAEMEFSDLLTEMLKVRIKELYLTEVYFQDDRGPWMIMGLSFTRHVPGQDLLPSGKVLRLDFDSRGIRGGWSRYGMNGDVNVRAEHAHVDMSPPDGISLSAVGRTVEELARAAAEWFQRHWDEWERVRDLPPKRTPWLGRVLGQPEWRYPS
jgi:hypothetical protein